MPALLHICRTRILTLIFICACSSLIHAQQHTLSLAQAQALAIKEPGTQPTPDTGAFANMTHTAWTRRDGAPGSISSLAQTTDGYLWIGSAFGLYRFDGVRFASYPFAPEQAKLPTQYVVSIASDAKGGLWIALRMTSVVHLHADGTTDVYGRESGLTSDTLDHIYVRQDGSVWLLAGGKLMTIDHGHWIDFGERHGMGHRAAFSIFFDRENIMWVAQDHRLVSLPGGSDIFRVMPASVFIVSAMAQSHTGKIWIADAWRNTRTLDQTPSQAPVHLQGRADLLADSKDSLWIAEDNFGLTRINNITSQVQPRPQIEHATSQPWLSSPHINALIEDREGNIWAGTALGIDRYQRTPFQHLRASPLNFYPSMVAANDGSVWINSHGEPLMRWDDGNITRIGSFVTSGPLATRRNGDVCFIDARASELQCYSNKGATYVKLDQRIEYAPALAIVEDEDSSILVSFQGKGIWRYNGTWQRLMLPGLPQATPLSMFLDSTNRLWFGFQGNNIAYRQAGTYRVLPISGSPWTSTLAFCDGSGATWIAGANGLAYFDGHAMHRVNSTDDDTFAGTSGITFDYRSNLWLNSGAGAIRVASDEVTKLLHDPNHRVSVEVFNDKDGIAGRPTQFKPTPSLIVDHHGVLWFATAGDLVRVDPQSFPPTGKASNILIENVTADGTQLPVKALHNRSVQIKSRSSHSLDFTFIAPNLSEPERINYRYRLQGEDVAWHESGSRHQAFYTNLSPGTYSFQASARIGQGPWVDLNAPLQIKLMPAFYQTVWFFCLLALLGIMLLIAAYLARLRQLAARIRLLADERAEERVKIARDLHDTLLQGIQGVMLRFHYTAQMVTDDLQRERLEGALGAADHVIAEGRDRLEHLRATDTAVGDLASQLMVQGTNLNWADKVAFSVHTQGSLRALRPNVNQEVFSIIREALNNAFTHSSATTITVTISFEKLKFFVTCADNGCGMTSAVSESGVKGHWGIHGMRERATELGAGIQFKSQPGAGTAVIIEVPARSAYEQDRFWQWNRK